MKEFAGDDNELLLFEHEQGGEERAPGSRAISSSTSSDGMMTVICSDVDIDVDMHVDMHVDVDVDAQQHEQHCYQQTSQSSDPSYYLRFADDVYATTSLSDEVLKEFANLRANRPTTPTSITGARSRDTPSTIPHEISLLQTHHDNCNNNEHRHQHNNRYINNNSPCFDATTLTLTAPSRVSSQENSAPTRGGNRSAPSLPSQSTSSSCTSSSSSSTASETSFDSSPTYSTVLSGDDSSEESSIIPQNAVVSMYEHGAPRNAGADDEDDDHDDESDDLFSIDTNLTLKSLKNRKKFEERQRLIKRLSCTTFSWGDNSERNNIKLYHKYLLSQEQLVRAHASEALSYLRRRSTWKHSNRARQSTRTSTTTNHNTPSINTTEQEDDEAIVRAIAQLNQNNNEEDHNDHDHFPEQLLEPPPRQHPRTRASVSHTIGRTLLFERFHSLPGIFALLMYVIAHTSFYEFFYHLHLSVFQVLTKDQEDERASHWSSWEFIYGMTFLFGVLLLRLSGGLFTSWTNDETYEGAKFDMHNKIRLGDWDAKVMKWLRRKRKLRVVLDIFAVYMCFISVGFFTSEKLLPAVCDRRQEVYEGLPSHTYGGGIQTSVHALLQSKKPYVKQLLVDDLDEEPVPFFVNDVHKDLVGFLQAEQCMAKLDSGSTYEDLMEGLEEVDAEYLYKTVSTYSFYGLYGWERTPVVTGRCFQSFQFVTSFASMVALFQMGVGFMDE
jgi:hypothetical protein